MIDFKSDAKKTVITIDKYDFYHDKEKEKRHENDTEATQKHTNNNVKNVKNEKKKESSKLKFETHHLKLAELLFREIKRNNETAKEPMAFFLNG